MAALTLTPMGLGFALCALRGEQLGQAEMLLSRRKSQTRRSHKSFRARPLVYWLERDHGLFSGLPKIGGCCVLGIFLLP